MEDKRARDPEKDLTFKGLCGGVSVDGGGGGGGGGGQYGGESHGSNLPIFKLQRLEYLYQHVARV